MEQQEISVQELLAIIGDKEVQLSAVRGRLSVALQTIELQKQKIASLESQTQKD